MKRGNFCLELMESKLMLERENLWRNEEGILRVVFILRVAVQVEDEHGAASVLFGKSS